jgi:hypothetical protein
MTDASGPVTITVSTGVHVSRCHPTERSLATAMRFKRYLLRPEKVGRG